MYESILNSGDWKPAWCELADLSDARLDHLPTDFVHQQLGFFKRQYRRLSMIGARVAVWAPGDLSFGLARIYQTLTEDNEVEQFVVFRQRVDALEWLLNPPDEES